MSKPPAWSHAENVFFDDAPWPTPREAKKKLHREINQILIEAGMGYSELTGKNTRQAAEVKERIAVITHTRLVGWFAVCEMGDAVGMKRETFEYALKRGKERLNDSLAV